MAVSHISQLSSEESKRLLGLGGSSPSRTDSSERSLPKETQTPAPHPVLNSQSPGTEKVSAQEVKEEPTQEELDNVLKTPIKDPGGVFKGKFEPFNFPDPAYMLTYFDDNLKEGIVSWHEWQLDINEFVARDEYTNKHPLKFLLVACNGSGKDAYVIAPFAIWHALCKIRSRCIITSSSYSQLESQTQSYIRTRCFQINQWCADNLGMTEKPVFLIKKDHIVCTLTHSEIKMFSTDSPGKAEGYHPYPDYPLGELAIIINEAKTVEEPIFEALSRCTFNRWLLVSSPGKTSGRLYNNYRVAVEWPEPYRPGHYYSVTVDSYKCPHKSVESIEADKREYGENSPIFRSKHLAKFTSLDEQVVLTLESWQKALNFPAEIRQYKNIPRRGGLDIGKGGDENSFYVSEGNTVIGYEAFRATDFVETTGPILVTFFLKYRFVKGVTEIFADDGGVGSALIDWLRNAGWNVIRIQNQSPPLVKGTAGQYGNLGAENYFRFARLVQENVINLEKVADDERLKSQITSRYYKQQETTGKIILESKKEARAKGHGSPDRADGLVLSFHGLSIHDFTDGLNTPLNTRSSLSKVVSQQTLADLMEEKRLFNYRTPKTGIAPSLSNPANVLRSIYD